jgi:hypothetical protein
MKLQDLINKDTPPEKIELSQLPRPHTPSLKKFIDPTREGAGEIF